MSFKEPLFEVLLNLLFKYTENGVFWLGDFDNRSIFYLFMIANFLFYFTAYADGQLWYNKFYTDFLPRISFASISGVADSDLRVFSNIRIGD